MAACCIHTARLRLDALTPTHLDAVHRMWTDAGMRRYLFDDEIVTRRWVEDALTRNERQFAALGYGLWGIRLQAAGDLAGFCGYWFFHDPPECELLYGLLPGYWKRGYASECARALVRYGFEDLGFEQVAASADVPNAASLRVLERAGLRFDAYRTVDGRTTARYVLAQAEYSPDAAPFRVFAA